jgi:predicted AAA+ superfamily ATPase
MLKRKIDNYIQDFYNNSKNALLITGARQIGKTFSIREFGKRFNSFIEINFIDNPQAIDVFKGAKNSSDILLRLSAITSKPLIKGETLIFFDEVQKCPEIVTAIKFLVEEGSYRYILSGSLLGVELKDLRSEPVGYMGVKDMFPLDFEEFISCVGINENIIESLRNSWNNLLPVDEFIHSKMMELFRLYLIVGGMPAVVNKYLETNNLQDVIKIQQDIIRLYKRDIAQYDPNNKLYIEDIFNLIPPELNSKNKRFILKKLNENAKFDRYQNSFLWLKNAGVALPIYNIEEPKYHYFFHVLATYSNCFKTTSDY